MDTFFIHSLGICVIKKGDIKHTFINSCQHQELTNLALMWLQNPVVYGFFFFLQHSNSLTV
jgi:hypothetical protein